MAAALQRWIEGSPADALLQLAASRRAEALSHDARVRMRPWVSAAEQRYRAARELQSDERVAVALALLREATRLCLGALRAAHGEDTSDAGQRERWTIIDRAELGAPVAEALARVRAAFSGADALGFEALSVADARALRADAERVVAHLLALAEAREPRQIRRSRWLRGALFLLLGLLSLSALLAYVAALRAISPP